MQRVRELCARRLCAAPVVAVGLVDRNGIGEFHHAFLDPLQLVSGPGDQQKQEEIHHRANGDLTLSDADGLHEDHVVSCRLTEQHRLARLACNTTEIASGRRRADETVRLAGEPFHARLVAQNAAAA